MDNEFKIGDNIHIAETNETGIVVGLVPGGYAIQTVKYTKVYPSSNFTFEKVFDEKEIEHIKKTNLDNAIVNKWSEIPGVWKKFKPYASIKINELDITDKGLSQIADVFCNEETDRPYRGVNFDENGVTMTDAHVLFFISGKVKRKGIFPMSKTALKGIDNETLPIIKREIKEKFPNYIAVIPTKNEYIGNIDCEKLLSYLKSTENYRNASSNYSFFAFGKDLKIGFNCIKLESIVKCWLALGHKKVYIGLSTSNRAAIISTDKKVCESPKENVGKKEVMLSLVMPIIGVSDDFLGCRDLDLHYESLVYFDFKDGEIHNSDGSVAEYNANEPLYTDILTEEDISLIKPIIQSNSGLIPITETAMIKDGYCYLVNIEGVYLKMKINGKIENGCYSLQNDYLRKTDYDIDDFPLFPETKFTEISFAKCNARKFAERLDYAFLFTGKDVLKPAFMNVNLIFSPNNLQFVSTDGYILYLKNFEIVSKFYTNCLLENSKLVSKTINSITHDTEITFSLSEKYILLKTQNIEMLVRINDSTFPDVKPIINGEYDGELIVDVSELKKLSVKEKKKRYEMSFDGKQIEVLESKQKSKVSNSEKYANRKKVNVGEGILLNFYSEKAKKAISYLKGNLKCYYKKGGQTLNLFLKLSDENMPFYITKPFKEKKIEKQTEFSPEPKKPNIEFAPEPKEIKKQYSDSQANEEIEKHIKFVEMMLSGSKTKIETDEWQKLLSVLKLLKPDSNVSDTDKKENIQEDKKLVSNNNNEFDEAIKAIASYNLDTKGYKNPDYFLEVAQYVKDFDMNDTLIQARYDETKRGVKRMVEKIIELDADYYKMTDEERKAVWSQKDGLLRDLIKFDVIGRIPKNLETLKQKSKSFTGVAKRIADKIIDKMSKVMPLLIKFESMKANIGVRKVLTEEEKQQAEKKRIEDKIYSQMPNVNKKVLTELIDELKKSFKPLEKEIYVKERERIYKKVDEYIDDKKISIKDTQTFFDFYDKVLKTGKYFSIKELKYTTSEGEKIYKDVYYYQVLGTQDDYDKAIHDLVTTYVEKQKTNFLLSVSDNFAKMTLPIKDFKKLYLQKGADGFEGQYLFNLKDGSKFTFQTQSVPAGGYNIQRFHYRYLSDFIDVKDSKGKKTTIWEMIDKYNKKNK